MIEPQIQNEINMLEDLVRNSQIGVNGRNRMLVSLAADVCDEGDYVQALQVLQLVDNSYFTGPFMADMSDDVDFGNMAFILATILVDEGILIDPHGPAINCPGAEA